MVMQKKIPLPLEIAVEDKKIQVVTTSGETYWLSVDCARQIQQALNRAIHIVADPELSGDKLFELLLEKTSTYFGLSDELFVKSQKRKFVQPRQMLMDYMDQRKCFTLKAIGNYFNGKDHTTVIHSKNTVKDLCYSDQEYRLSYERLTDYLNDVVSQTRI